MGIYKAAFYLIFLSLLLFTQYSSSTTSDRSAISGDGLVQSTRNGHSGGEGGGSGSGSGYGESSSNTQPGRPFGGAGTANTHHSHHHKGEAMNSLSYNFCLLTIAIFLSFCVSLQICA